MASSRLCPSFMQLVGDVDRDELAESQFDMKRMTLRRSKLPAHEPQ